jgi:predicted PurR-regulated permease PerM
MEMRKYLLFFLVTGLIGISVWYFSNIFLYLLIAGILSLIGQPIDHFFGKIRIGSLKISETLSAALAFLSLLLVFVLLAIIFLPLVSEEAEILSSISTSAAIASLQEPMQQLDQFFRNFHVDFSMNELEGYIREKVASFLTATNISLFFNQVLSVLGNFFVAFFAISFLTFFFLRDGKKVVEALLAVVPESYTEKAKNVLVQSQHLLKRYFIGILIEMLVVITLLSIGLSIAGVKHALLIALFAGIVNVIPYVGPLIGAGFALFIGLTTNTDQTMLGILLKIIIVFPIVNLTDAFLLQPLIYSNSVKAHPLEIFLVILLGATIGGIGGMILAVPSYTVLRVIGKEFFTNFRLVKRFTRKFDE